MTLRKSSGVVLDVRAAPENVFCDVSRYHHTITNNNVVTVKGMGDALGGGYDGATSYLDCGNHSSLNITSAITIEVWVKPAFIPTAATNRIVITAKDEVDVGGWGLRIQEGPAFNFYFRTPGYTGLSSSVTPIVYTEYHIVGTWDGTTRKIYVNTVVDSNTPSQYPSTTNHQYIGTYGGVDGYYFNGTIFLARIYNRALPAYEILDHYYEYATLLGLD